MQTHGGLAAEEAITGAERVIRASVQVDWDGDGLYAHPLSNLDPFIEHISLNKALQGSAPEEIILVEGTSVAEVTLLIAGEYEGMSLANAFSPYNRDSIFYGKQVVDRDIRYILKVETEDGLISYNQFVGHVRTVSPDRADNSVEITALDHADQMRKPIQLAPWAAAETHISFGKEDSQLIRSHWVMDNALRLCDAGAGDKRPTTREELGLAVDSLDGVQLWVTGNGSYIPTIGWMDAFSGQAFPNLGNPSFTETAKAHPALGVGKIDGLAGVGQPISTFQAKPTDQGLIRYWCADQDRINPTSVHYVGFTLDTNGPKANFYQTATSLMMVEMYIGNGRMFQVVIDDGDILCNRINWTTDSPVTEAVSARVPIPTGQDHVDCFMMWDATQATGSRIYLRAGSNSIGWSTFGSPPTTGGIQWADEIKGSYALGQGGNISNAFYATRNSGSPVINDTDFCYRTPKFPAAMDPGLNRFTFIPTARKQEAWGLIQQVAAAEWGSAFWDEDGVFRFWSWDTMLLKRNDVVRTFSMDDVSGLRLTNSSDSIRNVFAVTTMKKRGTGVEKIYTSSDVNEFLVPPNSEKSFVLWVDNVVSPWTVYMQKYDTDNANLNYPAWDTDPAHGYCIQYFKPFEGEDLWQEDPFVVGVPVRLYFTTDGYLMVRVENTFDYEIRFASGAGAESSPAFNAGGSLVKDHASAVILHRNDESIRKYGARSLDLSGEWYQDTVRVNTMFEKLLERTKEPTPATDAITVAGDPRLQLGDVVIVTDAQGFGEEIHLQILGIQREFTLNDGLTDTLTVEVIPPPGEAPPVDPEEPVYVTRQNLCPNPSAANNAKDFYSGTGRVTGVTGMPRTTAYAASAGGGISLPKTNVTPGKTYKMSAYIKSPSANQNGEVHIDWYSNYGYMDSSPNQAWSVSSGGVVRATCPAAVAPVGAAKGFLVVASHDATVQIGGILYEEGTSVLGDYFDGDSTGANWDGAQGNSQSRIMEEV